MNQQHISSIAIFLFVFQSLATDFFISPNQHDLFAIDTCSESEHFGLITEITSGTQLQEQALFSTNLNSSIPQKKELVEVTDSSVAFLFSDYSGLPLTNQITYTNTNGILMVDFKIEAVSDLTLHEELLIPFNHRYDSLDISLPGMKQSTISLLESSETNHHVENFLTLRNSTSHLNVVVRNPFHSYWRFNIQDEDANSAFILLHKLVPQERFVEGYPFEPSPVSGAVLKSGDIIKRRLELSSNNVPYTPMSFSEQPMGFSQAVTMYWDEIPTKNVIDFMTTEDADNIKYEPYFIRMLNKHPRFRMGYLFIKDRIFSRGNPHIYNWNVNSPFVIPDSLEPTDSTWAIMLKSDVTETVTLYQDVHCRDDRNYTLSYMVKRAIEEGNAYAEIYSLPSETIVGSRFVDNQFHDWQRESFSVTPVKGDTQLRVYFRIQEGIGEALFDDASLVSSDNSSKSLLDNGSFEGQNAPYYYDNMKRHWSDAHGYLHILGRGTEEFHKFLRRIENDSLLYGWEDRVRLGSHGYHHTPSLNRPDSPSPGWEFQHYDPYGDSLRFHRIVTENEALGLTGKSLKYFRSPGLRYTESMIHQLFKHDFVFFDRDQTPYYSSFALQRGEKQLWMSNNSWWADLDHNSRPTDTIKSYLERGHLGHIGGHPYAMFQDNSEESFQRFDSIFTDWEDTWPNMGYLFPDEYADNAISLARINDITFTQSGNQGIMTFEGATDSGNSVIIHGTCSSLEVNNTPIEMRVDGECTFGILPKLPKGKHKIVIKELQTYQRPMKVSREIEKSTSQTEFYLGSNSLHIAGSNRSLSIDVYNLKGQRTVHFTVLTGQAGSAIPLSKLNLARGVYILKISENNRVLSEFKIAPQR